jgi:dynein heavy chain 1
MIALLPGQLELLKRTETLIKNPLFRFLEREVTVASGLLDTVRRELSMLIEMCQGERKSTQFLKSLAEELHTDVIPTKWRKYTVPNISATVWVNDFIKRVEQLKKLSGQKDFGQSGLWYGGLLYPDAYLTATR